MRGGRKGSMQLSIEAIIILVIAMVLLGLGISFIQGFFRQAEDKTLEAFDPISFGCNPDSANPITISPSKPELKSGSQVEPKICVYANKPATQASLRFTSCTSTAPDAVGKMPQLLYGPQDIVRTETGGFETILTAKDDLGDDLPVGTYICTLEAYTIDDENLGTKQVTIAVI